MLQRLGEQIRTCHENAADAKQKAEAVADPALKASFLDLEKRWLALAQNYAPARQAADLNERTQIEQRFRWLASIVESSDDAIIGESLDGIIMSWNNGAQRLYGYTVE